MAQWTRKCQKSGTVIVQIFAPSRSNTSAKFNHRHIWREIPRDPFFAQRQINTYSNWTFRKMTRTPFPRFGGTIFFVDFSRVKIFFRVAWNFQTRRIIAWRKKYSQIKGSLMRKTCFCFSKSTKDKEILPRKLKKVSLSKINDLGQEKVPKWYKIYPMYYKLSCMQSCFHENWWFIRRKALTLESTFSNLLTGMIIKYDGE